MGDIMEFPNTVEEFMEEYKMVDKHEIYSNGTEYVPIFRMKQWFEHCKAHSANVEEVIRCEDCKWWDDKYEAERCTHDFGCRWAKPNNFCGYAERRTE